MDINQNPSTHLPSNLPTIHDPDKINSLVFGFGMFFMICLVLVFGQAFSSAEKTEEDKTLIEKIKKR
jgi:hypothetical protein